MKTKCLLFLSVGIFYLAPCFGQVRLEPFWPYSNYTLGISVGTSEIYGALNHSVAEPVYKAAVDRNFNSYSSVGIDLQHGAISSYETPNHWTNGMSEYNQFSTIDVHGRVSLGQFFKYPKNYLWKNIFALYVQTGFGLMATDITNITMKFKNRENYTIDDVYPNAIKQHKIIPYIPYNIGYNLHLTKRAMFNVNFQFCYTFSDYVDGYYFPQPQAHTYYNDMYSILSFGLIFNLGKIYDTWYDENGIKEKVRHLSD
jgi:hypothetical protein